MNSPIFPNSNVHNGGYSCGGLSVVDYFARPQEP